MSFLDKYNAQRQAAISAEAQRKADLAGKIVDNRVGVYRLFESLDCSGMLETVNIEAWQGRGAVRRLPDFHNLGPNVERDSRGFALEFTYGADKPVYVYRTVEVSEEYPISLGGNDGGFTGEYGTHIVEKTVRDQVGTERVQATTALSIEVREVSINNFMLRAHDTDVSLADTSEGDFKHGIGNIHINGTGIDMFTVEAQDNLMNANDLLLTVNSLVPSRDDFRKLLESLLWRSLIHRKQQHKTPSDLSGIALHVPIKLRRFTTGK